MEDLPGTIDDSDGTDDDDAARDDRGDDDDSCSGLEGEAVSPSCRGPVAAAAGRNGLQKPRKRASKKHGEVGFASDGSSSSGDNDGNSSSGEELVHRGEADFDGSWLLGSSQQQLLEQKEEKEEEQQQQSKGRRVMCPCHCCSKAISRHVMTCSSCGSHYHVECLQQAFLQQQQQQQAVGPGQSALTTTAAAAAGGVNGIISGGDGSSSGLVHQGRCLSCGEQLLWLELLSSMKSYAEPQAPRNRRRKGRWVWGGGEGGWFVIHLVICYSNSALGGGSHAMLFTEAVINLEGRA